VPEFCSRLTTSKAAKYEEYENIRAILSGKAPPHAKRDKKSKKKAPKLPTTPSKRISKHISKPSSTPVHQKQQSDSDKLAVESTPEQSKPLMLGPTPQKNGIFVGIFDHIFAKNPQTERTALAEVDINVPATPSKVGRSSPPEYERSKFTRTPMSEGRRFLLDQFITPRKRKRDQEEQERTPSSIAKRFMTPAFFKQYIQPMEAVVEEEMPKPKALPGKRPPFLKTLSSMIKESRHAEDDRLDEELELLNELEADQVSKPTALDVPQKSSSIAVVEKAGDLDQDGFVESNMEAELQEINEADAAEAQKSGVFRKIWKKRGQKRQTRKVNSKSQLPFFNHFSTYQYSQCGPQEANLHKQLLKESHRRMITNQTKKMTTWSKIMIQAIHSLSQRKVRRALALRIRRRKQEAGRRKPLIAPIIAD
jgi:hypothetical protein